VRKALKLLTFTSTQADLIAEARQQLGATYGQMGDFLKAKRELEKALKLYFKSGDLHSISRVHDLLGIAYGEIGDLDRGLAHFQQARQGWQKLSNLSELARTLNNLGNIYHIKGKYESALETLQLAIDSARKSANLRSEAWALITMGDVKRDMGDLVGAIDSYNDGLKRAERALDIYLTSYATCNIGNIYRLQGDLGKAEALIEPAVVQAQGRGQGYELGVFLLILGLLRCDQGRLKEGLEVFHKAIKVIKWSGNKRELARAHLYLAYAYFRLRRYNGAIKKLLELISILRELGYDDFLLPDAFRMSSLLDFAASKRIGGMRFVTWKRKKEEAKDKAKQHLAITPQPAEFVYPKVEAYGLGQAKVLIDGRGVADLEWRSKKSKEMFFYLLSHPRGATKEQIFEALWPECSPAKCNSYFHVTSFRLRRALYPQCLVSEGERYFLNSDGHFWFDIKEFDRLIGEAQSLPQGSDIRADKLSQAVALYKGPFLEDFYSEWCESLRRNLEEKYLRALSDLNTYYTAKGRYEAVINLLEKSLEIDPYQDEVWYQLINSYLMMGDQLSATRCYRRYAELLKRELGVEVPPKISYLYRQITKTT
jgi:two-component SAPR family response regulator/Flp pilus assembly protein TadD